MTTHRAYFVSDLHLFAQRSQADEHLAAIEEIAQQSETFVLGGDIFDFQWTTLQTIDQTIAAACAWLTELAQSARECQFHMLLGNHDHHDDFVEHLDALSRREPNLAWHPYYFRWGDSVFLHGDCADGDATHAGLEVARRKRHRNQKRGPTANLIYDVFMRSGLHRPVPAVAYPKRRTARRLLAYLNEIGHGPETGVAHVYFGHTHRSLDHYRYGGVTFHNGGAPMKGVDFRIVTADVTLPVSAI